MAVVLGEFVGRVGEDGRVYGGSGCLGGPMANLRVMVADLEGADEEVGDEEGCGTCGEGGGGVGGLLGGMGVKDEQEKSWE